MLFKDSNINQYTHKENTNIKRGTQGELPLHMHVFPFHPPNQQQENKRKKQSWLPLPNGLLAMGFFTPAAFSFTLHVSPISPTLFFSTLVSLPLPFFQNLNF